MGKNDTVAIVQSAVDLAQAAAKIDDLLAKVRGGDAAIEEAKRLIDDWRYEAGREFLAVRKQFPARGPAAKGWGDFVAARGISLDTAQRYMQLAELAQARPEAVRGKTVMDIYREHGLALPPPTERFPQGLPAAAENYPVKIKEEADDALPTVRPSSERQPAPPAKGPTRPPGQAADPDPAAARAEGGGDHPRAGGRPDPAGDRSVAQGVGPSTGAAGYTPLFADGPGAELAGLPRQTAAAPPPPFVVGQTVATSLGDLYLFERCEVTGQSGAHLRLWVRPFSRPAKGVSGLPLAESWGPGEALLQGGVRVLRVPPDEAIELGKMAPADQAEAARALFAPTVAEILDEPAAAPAKGAAEVTHVSQGALRPGGGDSPLLATLRASVTTLLRARPDRSVEVATLLRQLADEADPDHRTEAARQAQADRDLAEILDLRRRVGELEAGHDPAAATRTVIDAERDGYRRGKEEAEAAAKAAYKQGQEELLQVIAGWLHIKTEDVEDLRSEIEGKIQDIQADVLSSVGLALGIVDLDDDNPSLEDVLKAIKLLDAPRPCGTCELREAELQQTLSRAWPGLANASWVLLAGRVAEMVAQKQAAVTPMCPARTDEPTRYTAGDRVRLTVALNLGRIWPKGHGAEVRRVGATVGILLDNGAGLGVVDVTPEQIEAGPGRAACDAHATPPDPIEAARRLGAEHAEKRRRAWNSKSELGKLLKEVGAADVSVSRRAEIYAAYKEAFGAGKAAGKAERDAHLLPGEKIDFKRKKGA